jgi:heme/copper-type cytochrome/quinol oxidase subunit 2
MEQKHLDPNEPVNLTISVPPVRNGALLLVVFIGLLLAKLTGWVSWSWWVITLPLWLIPAIYLLVFFVVVYLASYRAVRNYTSTLSPKNEHEG